MAHDDGTMKNFLSRIKPALMTNAQASSKIFDGTYTRFTFLAMHTYINVYT